MLVQEVEGFGVQTITKEDRNVFRRILVKLSNETGDEFGLAGGKEHGRSPTLNC
jgi:hypothetical protein